MFDPFSRSIILRMLKVETEDWTLPLLGVQADDIFPSLIPAGMVTYLGRCGNESAERFCSVIDRK